MNIIEQIKGKKPYVRKIILYAIVTVYKQLPKGYNISNNKLLKTSIPSVKNNIEVIQNICENFKGTCDDALNGAINSKAKAKQQIKDIINATIEIIYNMNTFDAYFAADLASKYASNDTSIIVTEFFNNAIIYELNNNNTIKTTLLYLICAYLFLTI